MYSWSHFVMVPRTYIPKAFLDQIIYFIYNKHTYIPI